MLIIFLLGIFTLSDCQYFVEKFLSSISAKLLFKIIKYINKLIIDFYGQIEKKIYV